MADIKISELGSAASVNDTDVIPMTASGVTVKATATLLKGYMGVGSLTDLTTDDKTSLVNAVNEVDSHTDIVQAQASNSGDAYNTTRPYKVGELCIYNNVLYRCITACSAGSWTTNQSCFTVDTLVNAVNGISEVSEWNPTLYYANQTTPLSYDRIVKSCIKIGKLVTLFANLHITANGNGTGLRLTSYFSNPHLRYTPATSAVGTMIINGKLFGLIIDANSTYAAVTKATSEGDASVSDLPSIPSGGFTVCRISISYYTY